MARPPRTRRLARLAAGAAVLVGLVLMLRLTGAVERLFYHPEAGPTPIPAEAVPGAEGVWFEAADGTRLFGWFLPGRGGQTAGRAPSILHVHGNAGNVEAHRWFSEHLPPAGFNVFIFDYRGYGQSEGSARRREALIADTHAALDALLARPDVDPDRVGAYGQSLGGGIALIVMAERREIRAAVIESAFTGWRRIAANALGGDPPGPIARGLARMLIDDRSQPVEAIARIDRPILILHGTGDHIVPVSHGRALATAAPRAELVELPGGEHNSLRSTHPEVDGLTIDFLRTHLAPRPPEG